jgi:lysophospholipase L1-like esterase
MVAAAELSPMPTLLLKPNTKLLMIGDSITDGERARPVGEGLFGATGKGYVTLVDAWLTAQFPAHGIRVVNMGTSGNTVRDLAARWRSDVIAQRPDWLSICIGVNDVWRQFDLPRQPEAAVAPDEYAATLEKLVRATRPKVDGLVLMTPFFIESNPLDAMRARMDQYGAIVRRIAQRQRCILVDTQAAFAPVLEHLHSAAIAWDRVHPNHVGHHLIAQAFLRAVGAA